jgi:DNA polymerase iota
MTETATETKDSEGRDIGRMLKKQDEALKNREVMDEESFSEDDSAVDGAGSEDGATPLQPQQSDGNLCQDDWEIDNSAEDLMHACRICGSVMPLFAVTAHDRYHSMAEW